MGIFAQDFLWAQTDNLQSFFHLSASIGFIPRQLELVNRSLKDCVHLIERIVSSKGVLKNRLYFTTEVELLAPGKGRNVAALVQNLPSGRMDKLQGQICQRRFAAAALAGNRG